MNDPNCLFCKIVDGKIPAKIVHDDALCVAFEDLNPQAPVHVLVVPRKHVATTNDLLPEDEPMVGHLVTVAAEIAKARGVDGSGYRTALNCNRGAGQSVFHLHLHLLGGRSFAWPPG
ncbi:MAG: histidine triad nucleotide-binding protein [Acidobacteria bacterium]|jgi:histidine triad (HIT) family protein|nr:histidine triad nucleotide-binding protein [Acidobacteriota bacterium]